MHTGKRTRSIRLKDLKTRYLEQLRTKSFEVLQEALHRGTVLPREVEDEVWTYYRKTAPSLQEFYSRYTPEWDAFYENENLSPDLFLDFLRRMQSAFRKRYALSELNVAYYIESLERLPLWSEERKRMQEFFLNKWHHLLTVKESDYQYLHIRELCEGFVLLDKASGMKTVENVIGSRLRWLLLNHPELYRSLAPYEKEWEHNRNLQELVRLLGRNSRGEKREFASFSGIRKEQLVHHAVRSDIQKKHCVHSLCSASLRSVCSFLTAVRRKLRLPCCRNGNRRAHRDRLLFVSTLPVPCRDVGKSWPNQLCLPLPG